MLIGNRQEAKFLAPGLMEYSSRQTDRTSIKIDSHMWIPHLPNIAHGCSQHGPGTSWLTSEWPGNITFAKNTNFDGSNFLSQGQAGSHCHTAKAGNRGTEATVNSTSIDCFNILRTGLLNCLNARSRGLTFRHRASCIQRQAFLFSPENAFYIFNQQIYFII